MSVLFFASLREVVGVERITVDATSLAALMNELKARFTPEAYEELTAENVRIALNQELVNGDPGQLQGGDEIAFLPPVTGG